MVEACDISVVVEAQGKRDATVLRVTVTGATLSGVRGGIARAGDGVLASGHHEGKRRQFGHRRVVWPKPLRHH